MIANQGQQASIRWIVQIRAESGLRSIGTITDLSANGCCIQTDSKPPRVTSKILVRPDGLDGFEAVVKWARGRQFGCDFLRPIYGPVLEHFLKKHSTFKALIDLT